MSSNILSKEQILGADDLQTELIDVPEWGGSVYIQEMTSRLRDYFEASMIHDGQSGKAMMIEVDLRDGGQRKIAVERLRAKLVALSVVNAIKRADGTTDYVRMFDVGDEDLLAQKSPKAINRIAEAVMKLNAMTPEEVEQIKNDSGQTTG